MNLAETRLEQLQDVESMSLLAFDRAALLSRALVAAYPQQSISNYQNISKFYLSTSGESSSLQALQFNEKFDEHDTQLLALLKTVHDELRSSQEELDEFAKSALYANLWDLYE